MGKSYLLVAGADLIAEVRDLLPKDREALAGSLVVFPGHRPAHFLRQSLTASLGGPYQPPAILSMEEFVDLIYVASGGEKPRLPDLDALSILYELHRTASLPGRASPLSLNEFLPWGSKLLGDLEDLKSEQVDPARLEGLEGYASSEIPPGQKRLLADLSRLYQDFYAKVSTSDFTTRANRYAAASQALEEKVLLGHPRVILAGFYGLNRSEVMIFKALKELGNTSLIFQGGPGIYDLFAKLGIDPEPLGTPSPGPEVLFHQAADRHGEVMALAQELSGRSDLGQNQVIVLPASQTLFPVLHQVLSRVPGEYNVSLGYPLTRTPAYALLETLARVLEGSADGRYFLPDYLGLALHPYIKNIYQPGLSSASSARILWHTVEESLMDQGARFLTLEEVESSEGLLEDIFQRLVRVEKEGLDTGRIRDFITGVHDVLLKPFERLEDIADFCRKLAVLLSRVSEASPANQHSYAGDFLRTALETLDGLSRSALARERLPEIGDYFRFLRTCLTSAVKHFPGTPLRGLQVLGTLETRNLRFDEVFVLDANEGVLPSTSRLDSLLPLAVRKSLGLATYQEREQIQHYQFSTLLAGCRRAHLFFVQNDDQFRSRFVEEIHWQEQQRSGRLELGTFRQVHFSSTFNQSAPLPAEKSLEVLSFLHGFVFSPTSLDEYLKCPLRFYYKQVLGLGPKGDLDEGLDPMETGSVVHGILNDFFKEWEGKVLRIGNDDEERLLALTRNAFEKKFGGRLSGRAYLLQSQALTRMREVLRAHRDPKFTGMFLLGCEQWENCSFEVSPEVTVRIKGKIDRVDERRGETVLVDYKTGSSALLPSRNRFDPAVREDWIRTLRSVQIPMYLLIHLAKHPKTKVERLNGSLLLLGKNPIKEEFLFKDGADRVAELDGYRRAIATLIAEILSPDLKFDPTAYPQDHCPGCDFKVFCGRQWMEDKRA